MVRQLINIAIAILSIEIAAKNAGTFRASSSSKGNMNQTDSDTNRVSSVVFKVLIQGSSNTGISISYECQYE
ncbi:hypothetical protein VCR9J2_1610011 [Vibrio crassostreae]|nr:hypothetical protein VCR9J2_1610011 [Vibrio crassostreae]